MIGIAQLSYSKSTHQNSDEAYTSSTGGFYNVPIFDYTDSVYVSIEELKIANTKMAELKFTNEIIANLNQRIANDDEIIENLTKEIEDNKKQVKKYKITSYASSGIAIILLLISLL